MTQSQAMPLTCGSNYRTRCQENACAPWKEPCTENPQEDTVLILLFMDLGHLISQDSVSPVITRG